ncbi:hybrid sensor histidine kinase/response regulator [Burkholderia sp. SFA1]|uniref:hybrid sensor histidine kinase/response regulator n=1 Tax=unclassified Caballeronia TaxID=2646786 RepID=UPI001F24AA3C|nr:MULTISPECIES: hybrid sensor histidine kinase/response regulator [unclassified Caballeronia]MCE4543847.1 hybrid sensor histidine kinase/response regulator [Caballeronia sp. PC1]MCE4571000.1 hybrid sensor histidine kinase/response regulator [Caballeronia sp. CLC5]BBP99157.1 hybrid sensor histidine kinase/response regulator [Burkholderia sp. SFA1]
MTGIDPGRSSLLDLFQEEARAQAQILSDGLIALERAPRDPVTLEASMRAAHSLKGAARVVGVPVGVTLAHAMEDCFVAAQDGRIVLDAGHIDMLLRGVDLIVRIGEARDIDAQTALERDVESYVEALNARLDGQEAQELTLTQALAQPQPQPQPLIEHEAAPSRTNDARMLRMRADTLDRLLSHSGESLVESRWLKPFSQSMLRVKRIQHDASRALERLHETLTDTRAAQLDARAHAALDEVRRLTAEAHRQLSERLAELENYDRRSTHLAQQIYDEALACRMRPFVDATGGFARMVRDVARGLGRDVRLVIAGETTQVDRDILDLLDAPLGHLLRNAVDHGIEEPSLRRALGKPETGTITLEARHSAGSLFISVSDDGAGVDLDALRRAVVRKQLANEDTAARLTEAELLEFLFLPGFTMRDAVTDVSGRGVGLDAVQDVVRQVRGSVRVTQEAHAGTRFTLQLPLTLSVIRSLIVDVAGEPYGLPLAHVVRTLVLPASAIDTLEGQQHFSFDGKRVGLVTAHQILQTAAFEAASDALNVVVIGQGAASYGVVVDRFLGERMLVVQPLDKRLGKVRNIAAGALMENGDPLLIADLDDWLRSVETLVGNGELGRVGAGAARASVASAKRVLVVDDSLTVRELERKLLASRGYDVSVAVDGMDGWNAVRGADFDLVITDIDMPRLDGIELVTLIKRDAHLSAMPVMIVSYKDRAEDRQRGLDAGADYYLAKGSFHDQALIDAVRDLIGEARS